MSVNLFAKFDALEVKASDRIPEEDVLYCENQQRLYDQAIGFLQDCLQKTQNIYNSNLDGEYKKDGYIDKYDDIRHFEDRIEKVKQAFSSRIKYYFTGKYKITVGNIPDREVLHYSDIVEEIFEQLGGLSFQEKAAKEIKDNLKISCRRGCSDENKVIVKNKKVIINGFVWATKCSIFQRWEIGYNSRDTLVILFKALSHYESGSFAIAHSYEMFLKLTQDHRDSVFDRYELGYNKVEAIRVYKNGKTEIEFSTGEQAQIFAKDYCGFVEGLVA